ncbi:MAG: RluA family pseudouridine synthase [Verrucomicrobiae bacterium]|nr:RluA family pseudouridine synthase [Verrucomicrobiae bacterium]
MNDSSERPPACLKLSSPETREYWEVPVVFEDEHLLAVDKPSGLLTSPDRYDPQRPNLMGLLHAHIRRGVPWVRERGLTYLANAHRLDFETSGVLLLAKSKPVLTALADLFGSEKPIKTYHALAHGGPPEDAWTVEAKLGPHPTRPGVMRVHPKFGKRSRTDCRVITRFNGFVWLECRPLTGRTHQIRVHLQWAKCPIVGDALYGGGPLWLSEVKPGYRRSRNKEERPLMARVALHASILELAHPVTGEPTRMECPIPRDLRVALKYLERYALPGSLSGVAPTL